MASPDVSVSKGFTIVFPTSAYSVQVVDVTPPGTSCEDIETTHQNTTTARTYTAGGFNDNGEMVFTVHEKPDTVCPVGVDQTDIVVTFPNSETWTFDGHIKGHEPEAPLGGKITATITVKVSGDIARA